MSSSSMRSLLAIVGSLVVLCADVAAQRQRISIPLGESGHVDGYEVAPDGRSVVYHAYQGLGSTPGLYAAGLRDGASKLLDATAPIGGFEIASDSRRVVFARAGGQICSVPIDGSAPAVVIAKASAFAVSPDARNIVLRMADGLWVAPIDGASAPALLHAHPRIDGHLEFSPDGSRVLYLALGLFAGQGRLHSARLDRSLPPVPLSFTPDDVRTREFTSSPDGQRALFSAGLPSKFFSAPIDGGVATWLNPTQSIGYVDFVVHRPRFTPDGDWMVYERIVDTRGRRELYSVPVLGGVKPIQLNAPLVADGAVFDFRITVDGTRVLYLADQDVDSVYELFDVPLTGGVPVELSQPGESVSAFDTAPDGRHVAYIAQSAGAGRLRLATLVPGIPVRTLSDPAATPQLFGFGDDQAYDPTGRWIAYAALAFESGAYRVHLYAVESEGVPHPVRLDAPSSMGSTVATFGLLFQRPFMRFAGGPLAVFRANLAPGAPFQLWATRFAKQIATRH